MNSLAATGSQAIEEADAFDGSAAPVVFMSENRMPVMVEFNKVLIYIFFSALIMALLFILPGVRKTKLTSFLGLLTLLSVGATILLALDGSNWLTGSISIQDSRYSSLSRAKLYGKLEINIGLKSVNVTLIGKLEDYGNKDEFFSYNERFFWNEPDRMQDEHYEALKKGLPYPILTVTEFLSQDSDGFNWSRHLRQAGYYTSLVLYLALASWLLMGLIMCVLPVYLPHLMQITGALLILSVWIYTLLIQSPKLYTIQMNGGPLELLFGSTYMITFISGALSMFAGLIMMAIQKNSNPSEQFTIMDSEQYVKDKKALYNNNDNYFQDKKSLSSSSSSSSSFPSVLFFNSKSNSNNNSIKRTDHQATPKSVVIPMNDIEENFNNAHNSNYHYNKNNNDNNYNA